MRNSGRRLFLPLGRQRRLFRTIFECSFGVVAYSDVKALDAIRETEE